MNEQNAAQALENEQQVIQEDEDQIDYVALYGGEYLDDEPLSEKAQKKIDHTWGEIAKDVGEQGLKNFLIGVGGAYGSLSDLVGLNPKEERTPGQKAREGYQRELLNKQDQPGYIPSFSEIYAISDSDDDIAPVFSRLPNTQDLEEINKKLGGPGEAKTVQGRYAGRIANIAGAGVAFGALNPISSAAAGAAGQTVEEAGGGPLLQAAAEIVTLLATQGRSGRPLSSGNAEVQQRINALRNAGYTDEEITLAINSAYKDSRWTKTASKGSSTEEAFENFANKSDQLVSSIIEAEIPGIGQGTQAVHQAASDAYAQVARNAGNITITNPRPFADAARRVETQLRNNLGMNPDAQGFLNRISEAVQAAYQYPTAQNMMNFYKELNAAGKWMGRSERDRLINIMKDGVKDTFRAEGQAGRQLAEDFERVNAGVRRAYQAEDLMDILNRSATQDGINYNSLRKAFDKGSNVELMEEVLGVRATNNLRMVANAGKQVKDFDKAWKKVNQFAPSASDVVRTGSAAYFLWQGDWSKLAAVLASKGGRAVAGKIAEKSLTSPAFQRLWVKGLHALAKGSPKLYNSAEKAMKKYLKDEGLDIEFGGEYLD